MFRGIRVRWWLLSMPLVAFLLLAVSGCATEDGSRAVDVTVSIHDDVGGLAVDVSRVRIETDRVLVSLTLRNASSQTISVFLGGCGPSQGRLATSQQWIDLYYAYAESQGDDFSQPLPPGSARRGTIVLRTRPGGRLAPAEAVEFEFHPGHVLNHDTFQIELMEVRMRLASPAAAEGPETPLP